MAIKYSSPSYFSLGATPNIIFSWSQALQSIVQAAPFSLCGQSQSLKNTFYSHITPPLKEDLF